MENKLIIIFYMYLYVKNTGALRSFAVCAFFMLLALAGRAQQTTGSQLPAGFPVYKDTGNPQEDAQRYDAANKAWMAANPGVLPAMVNSQRQAPVKAEKENKGAIVEQKTATIPPNQHYTQEGIPIPAPQKAATEAAVQPEQKQVLPANYPKLVDTGNPEQDHRKFDAAKQAWIAANPGTYAKMFEGQSHQGNAKLILNNIEQAPVLTKPETVNSSPTDEQKAVMMPPPHNPNQNTEQQEMPVMPIAEQIPAPSKKIELPNDYPKYVDTGNVEEDIANYTALKEAWIAAHPQEYINLNQAGALKKHIIDKQELEQMPLDKRKQIEQNHDLFIIWDSKNSDTHEMPK